MAKALIAAAYGRGPDRSYIGGCSNGGRHTFVAMTRTPAEYDGYPAGAPGYRLPLAAVANQFGAQQYARVATSPPANPSTFDGPAYALSTPIDAMLAAVAATNGTYRESALSFMLPVEPANLAALRRRGAKVLVYHGVSDAIFSVDDTTSHVSSACPAWATVPGDRRPISSTC